MIYSKKFNEEVFGNIFRRKRLLEARVKGIQRSIETCDSLTLAQIEKELQEEYNLVLRQEELLWL